MRIAYYSPLPLERSGVADYSALLLPALERRLDVAVVRRGRTKPPRNVELCVYQVGNNVEAHGWILDALRLRPGLVVLHDVVLHHLIAGATLGRGDREGYLGAMQADAGAVGRLLAHGVVDGLVPPLWETRPHDFPLTAAVHRLAKGIVVHSRHAEDWLRRTGYDGPVWRIPHPAWPDPHAHPDPALREAGGVVVGCIGHLNRAKGINRLVAAFAEAKRAVPDAVLLLAGTVTGVDLEAALAGAGLEPGRDIVVTGHVPEERLWSLLAACDVCVNLRRPSMGETSGSVIRALVLGKPLVVSDLGWFSELPDGVAAKVVGDEREPEVLAATLTRLAADGDLRAGMGSAALEYVRREHDLERSADLYLAAIEEAAGGDAVRDAVLGEVAAAAQDVGIGPFDPELRDVGARMREAGLGG